MIPDPLRPPETDEEPWAVPDPLTRSRSRDLALLCFAGLVLLVIAAWWVGRP